MDFCIRFDVNSTIVEKRAWIDLTGIANVSHRTFDLRQQTAEESEAARQRLLAGGVQNSRDGGQ